MEIVKIELVKGHPSVLRIDGEIDLATADELRAALGDALSADPKLVVDMEGVTFFDATGIRVLLQVAATLNGDGPLRLVHAGRVAQILELVGLSEMPSIAIRDEGDISGG